MGLITNDGRIALAKLLVNSTLYVAWGNGDPAWDSTPEPESATDTTMVAEIGRRAASQVAFAAPSETGTIFVDTGNYDISATPTRYVYVRGTFDFADSVGQVIREAGVYAFCALGTISPGQTYFAPSDLSDPGLMLINTRFTGFTRLNTVRQTFEFVIAL